MGKEMLDMTKGSPMRNLLAFSIPVLVGNVLNQLYSITDSIIVGRVLGLDALAAVGCTMPIVLLMAAVMIGVNVAVSILLSQAYGARDFDLMRRGFVNSLYMGLLIALLMALVGTAFSAPILRLMGTPDGPFDDALAYMRVCFITAVCPLFYYLLSCAYRGMGDSRTDLYFLIISVAANVFLDYLFVAVYGWGVAGSAWATALAQLFSVFCSAAVLFIKYPQMRFRWGDLRPDKTVFTKITKLAIPIALQTAFNNLGNIVAQGVINKFDAAVMAAYTAAGRVGSFALMPLETVGSSLSVYTGQNYGAGETKRIHEGLCAALKLQVFMSSVLGAVMILFGRQISGLFLEEVSEEMLRVSYEYLLVAAVPGILAGIMIVYQQVMRGIGETKKSTYSGFVQLGTKILVIIVGYLIVRKPIAVWAAWPVSFAAAAFVAVLLYRKHGLPVLQRVDKDRTEQLGRVE